MRTWFGFGLLIIFLLITPVTLSDGGIDLEQSNQYTLQYINTAIELDSEEGSIWNLDALLVNDLDVVISEIDIEVPYIVHNIEAQSNGTDIPILSEITGEKTHVTLTFINSIPIGDHTLISLFGEFDYNFVEIEENLYQFKMNWNTNFFCSNYSVSITLPAGSTIDTNREGLVIPRNTSYQTDGEKITLVWRDLSYESTTDDNEILLQFLYAPVTISENQTSLLTLIVTGIIAALVGGCAVYLYFRKLSKDRVQESHIETKLIEKVRPVLLSPNEIEVLRMINDNDGGIKQADLVTMLNVTKARVSQYLSKLEEQGFIKKSKMGRQNYIILESHVVLDFDDSDGGMDRSDF